MGRLHLFEFGDQEWLPAQFRAAMTSYLRVAYGMTPLPRLWAERMMFLLAEFGDRGIVDLGSGAAGPVPLVLAELNKSGLAPVQQRPSRVSGVHARALDGAFESQALRRAWGQAKACPTLPGQLARVIPQHHLRRACRPVIAEQR